MAKKIIFALLTFLSLVVLINLWSIIALQKNVKTYLRLNLSKSENEQLIKNSAKKIVKNYKKINKNLKKIFLNDFSEDLSKILPHFLNDKNLSYLVILQNSDELRATGGFMGSYFFLEFSHGMLNLTPIQDIYDIAGQQQNFPTSPRGHAEYLSEGKGLFVQDANWWPDSADSAEKILQLWQEIAKQSPYLDQNREIAGIIFINLNFIEKLLTQIGPIQLADYDKAIDAQNFAQLARADRLDFFPGSSEKANFLDHSKVAIENQLSQLSFQEYLALGQMVLDNLENKNIQLYSQDSELQKIWQKHHFAGQLRRNNPNNFYFYSIETNVGINKANRLLEREFHFYQHNEQMKQIQIKFTNNNQKPTVINNNPDLKIANHLSYINYQRLYLDPEIKIKQIQTVDEKGKTEQLDFSTQAYFNRESQEFLELSFLTIVAEQKLLDIIIDLESDKSFQGLEIQKQSGVEKVPVYLYQNQDLVDNWTLTRDQLE
jgi:hypothetical protein